jgi:hypothetical protein
VVAQ